MRSKVKRCNVLPGMYGTEVFRKRLIAAMGNRRINVSHAAKTLGVSNARIHSWIKGHSIPTLTDFCQLVNYLLITPDQLLQKF